jgi:fructose-1,6-bisphosphatase/inositol monophosphatase family enzyme
MASLLNLGTSVRRGGSGALALAWVAEGRTDGYVEIHMNAWDCLAGMLLVREAGGRTGIAPDTAEGIFNGLPVLAVAPASPPNWPVRRVFRWRRTRLRKPRRREQRPTLARR